MKRHATMKGIAALPVVLGMIALVLGMTLGRADRALASSSAATTSAPSLASATAPVSRPAVGVNYHALWDYDDASERLPVIDKLDQAGLEWVRIDFGWCSLQHEGPNDYQSWYVQRADAAVNEALARGFKVLMMVDCTPGWANGHAGDSWDVAAPIPPDDPADFGRVARWLADHFKGRVSAWEAWNEPNHPNFFSGTPADYVRLLRASYPQFKAGDPNALVVSAGTSYQNIEWLEEMYRAGARGYFDVLATHPYMGPSDKPPEWDDGSIWTIRAVSRVHDLMARYGDGAKNIWFTEFGWSSHRNVGGEMPWDIGVTEEQQGEFFVRTISMLAADYPYVTNVFWYNDRNMTGLGPREDNYGLLYRDLAPKPAYQAIKTFLTADTGSVCTITGTAGPDVLSGTDGDDVICGLDGNDEIRALGGNDVVMGGNGDDRLRGGEGNDLLLGGPGNDVLRGGRGNDVLKGEEGRDVVRTTDSVSGNDTAVGGPDSDACKTDVGDSNLSCP